VSGGVELAKIIEILTRERVSEFLSNSGSVKVCEICEIQVSRISIIIFPVISRQLLKLWFQVVVKKGLTIRTRSAHLASNS
jgi:hypothetical protein